MDSQLPPEIWKLIVESGTWSPSDLRRLRLTNQTLSEYATPLLFNSILLRPNLSSLKRAKRVASIPHVASHIRRLYMREDQVDQNIITATDFVEAVDKNPLPGYDKAALRESADGFVKFYPAMVKDQQAYGRVDFNNIAAICRKLPNLSVLDFSCDGFDPTSNFSKTYGFERRLLIDHLSPVDEQLKLCQAAKVTSLVTCCSFWDYYLEVSSYRSSDVDPFTGLQNLQHLDIRINISTQGEAGEITDDEVQSLHHALGYGTNVEHLDQIDKFVCHRGDFPFPRAARTLGLTHPCLNLDRLENTVEQGSCVEDRSNVGQVDEANDGSQAYRLDILTYYNDSSWAWCEEHDERWDFKIYPWTFSFTENHSDTESEIRLSTNTSYEEWARTWGLIPKPCL